MELFPRPSFILKRQLLWLPLFGWYMWKAHMIPVDRGKGSGAIEAMTGARPPRHRRGPADHHLSRKARAGRPSRRRNTATA